MLHGDRLPVDPRLTKRMSRPRSRITDSNARPTNPNRPFQSPVAGNPIQRSKSTNLLWRPAFELSMSCNEPSRVSRSLPPIQPSPPHPSPTRVPLFKHPRLTAPYESRSMRPVFWKPRGDPPQRVEVKFRFSLLKKKQLTERETWCNNKLIN